MATSSPWITHSSLLGQRGLEFRHECLETGTKWGLNLFGLKIPDMSLAEQKYYTSVSLVKQATVLSFKSKPHSNQASAFACILVK